MARINFKKVIDQVIQKAPGLIVGSVVSTAIAKQTDKMAAGSAQTPYITAGVLIAAGALLPGLTGSTGKKGQFFQSVADGIMSAGAIKMGKAFKIPGLEGIGGEEEYLSGLGTAEDYMQDSSVSGTQD